MQFLYTAAIIFLFFGISFALINIRHLLTGKEFRGTCSTNNPMIKNTFGDCTVCGKTADEACKMPDLEGSRG
jgi:hypothetical protein